MDKQRRQANTLCPTQYLAIRGLVFSCACVAQPNDKSEFHLSINWARATWGMNTQHIHVFQTQLGAFSGLQHLSTMDVYLDPVSFLPLDIGFNVHPDNDMNTDTQIGRASCRERE